MMHLKIQTPWQIIWYDNFLFLRLSMQLDLVHEEIKPLAFFMSYFEIYT